MAPKTATEKTPRPLLTAARRALLQSIQHLVNAEAAGPLAGWELLERLEELPDDLLRGDADEGVVEPPVVVRVRRNVGSLIWVHPQIVELRKTHGGERLTPDLERSLGALLGKDELPVVVAQADEVGVVVEVVELRARALGRLAGQVRQQVV